MNAFINKNLLLQPIIFIDIGSRGGVQKKWLIFKDKLNVIGFEPDKEEYDRMQNEGLPMKNYNIGLWKEKGIIDFYLTRTGRCSSNLEPNREVLDEFPESDRFDIIKKTKIPVNTLDNILNSSNKVEGGGTPDFVKLDTQGTELYILQGMTETINRSIFCIEIEVEFISMYCKQPLFHEVDEFMHSQGFQLFDIKKYYWRRKCGLGLDGTMRGQIAHGDALYFRNPDVYINLLKNSNVKSRKRLLIAVAIALFYGYSDYAINLLECGKNSNLICEEDYTLLLKNISRSANKILMPDFKGKNLIGRFIRKFLTDHHKGWAIIDKPDVGNNFSHYKYYGN